MTAEQTKLVEDNVRLVSYMIKSYGYIPLDHEEAFAIGCVGLTKAAVSYNGTTRFSTYACKCINNELLLQIRRIKRNAKYSIVPLDSVCSYNNTLTVADTIPDDFDIEFEFTKPSRQFSFEKLLEEFVAKPDFKRYIQCYFSGDRENARKIMRCSKHLPSSFSRALARFKGFCADKLVSQDIIDAKDVRFSHKDSYTKLRFD